MSNHTSLYKPYTVAEFFCGCGGFSYGFQRTGRFDVVLGNDLKKAALRTFAWNHTRSRGRPAIIEGDIREIRIEVIADHLAQKGVGEHELDVLIGGPPCQGFSQMRRSEERKDSEIVKFKGYNPLDEDPRNDLVLRFLEIAAALCPKVIIIENVPQILQHHHNGVEGGISAQVQATLLNEMGYDVVVKTLNAADYGVPQLRERAFFIASRVGPISFPDATHIDTGHENILALNRPAWVTVRDAINDLPVPLMGVQDTLGGGALDSYAQVESSIFAQRMRSKVAFPYNHLTRRYAASVLRIIREMEPGETWDHASKRMRQHYTAIVNRHRQSDEQLEQTITRLDQQGIITAAFFKKYYWSAYTRLAWDKPALTITANANFLGSGRFTHPEQQRGITMREAARLQSFDDDFRFITSPTDDSDTTLIGVGMDMIGEAVPPLLAEAIAHRVTSCLDSLRIHRNQDVETAA